jgi:hypothetical protein
VYACPCEGKFGTSETIPSTISWRPSFQYRSRSSIDGRADRFTEDGDSRIICRWRHRDEALLVLDVMPTRDEILGFANRWYSLALAAAVGRELPSGAIVRAVPPVPLLATKVEAFHGRGQTDFLASHDFEDIVLLMNGRPELASEVAGAQTIWPEMAAFITDAVREMRGAPYFSTGVHGALAMFDPGRGALVEDRFATIAAMA